MQYDWTEGSQNGHDETVLYHSHARDHYLAELWCYGGSYGLDLARFDTDLSLHQERHELPAEKEPETAALEWADARLDAFLA